MFVINCQIQHTGYRSTFDKSVAGVTGGTAAHRYVIYDVAYCRLCARSRTGISTFISHAGTIASTVSAHDTFRPASYVWVALILRQTGAYSVSAALSVRTAW